MMRDYNVPYIPDLVWKKPSYFIAFGFGSGALPFAPGTFGTLMAIPFYLALRLLPNSLYLLTLAIISIASMWLCNKISEEIGIDDHQGMCLDEFIGFFVTMYAAPPGVIWIVWGFILFRIFDIWKPWPIKQLDENVKGGFGMIFDDILAGIYAFIVLHLLHWLF